MTHNLYGNQIVVILSKECFEPGNLAWGSAKQHYTTFAQEPFGIGIRISDSALHVLASHKSPNIFLIISIRMNRHPIRIVSYTKHNALLCNNAICQLYEQPSGRTP